MLVQVYDITQVVNEVIYLASHDKSMMLGAFFVESVEGNNVKLRAVGMNNVAVFDLDEIRDFVYYNDYREIDDLDDEDECRGVI